MIIIKKYNNLHKNLVTKKNDIMNCRIYFIFYLRFYFKSLCLDLPFFTYAKKKFTLHKMLATTAEINSNMHYLYNKCLSFHPR